MPSLQARIASELIKLFLRRRQWGRNEEEVARRARRKFGSPKIFQWYKTLGLKVEKVAEKDLWGEWITAPDAEDDKIILYIHGGGYVSCSAATHRPITATLARLSRLRVFSLNYRRAPEHKFPAAHDDVIAGYQWLLKQRIEPSKIALAGDSAGGGLVLATLLRMRDENLPFPSCAVVFSPWTDLTGNSKTLHSNDGRCALFRPENIYEFGKAYLGNTSPDNIYVSQVLASFEDLPPILFQVGSTELLLDDSRSIHDKIQSINGISQLEIFEDLPHCWQMFDGIMPEARIALKQATNFILKYME